MPKGMTPKKRMLKSTAGLARALKPTGRLNVDDMKRASDARKNMSLSEIKKRKTLGKKVRNVTERIDKIKDIEKYMNKKPRRLLPERGPMQTGPRKMRPLPITPEKRKKIDERRVPSPRAQSTRMDKGPKMVKPLRRALARRK